MNLETGVGNINAEKEVRSTEQIRQKIAAEFAELGISECPREIIDHYLVLEMHSKFNNDSRMIREGFGNVIDAIEKRNDETIQLTPEQKREGALAAFAHDIGKSSSSEDPACRLAVVRLFGAEKIKNPQLSVREGVSSYFPEETDTMLSNLSKVQVTPDMTMREFWDMHAFWTKEILDKFPDVFSERTRLVAASHHIDRGINPYGIDASKVPDESKAIGALEYYVDFLEERALMAVDKYQAIMNRGKATHSEAMEYLKDIFIKYKNEPVMTLILETIDELGGARILFPKTQEKNLTMRG